MIIDDDKIVTNISYTLVGAIKSDDGEDDRTASISGTVELDKPEGKPVPLDKIDAAAWLDAATSDPERQLGPHNLKGRITDQLG